MEPKFSQGEWFTCEHSWSEMSVYTKNNNVCMLSIRDESTEDTQDKLYEEMKANANLIAAARKMYYALERASAVGSSVFPDDLNDAIDAALAKARGE